MRAAAGLGPPRALRAREQRSIPGGQGPRREGVQGHGGASDGVSAKRRREGRETRGDAHQNGRFSAAASLCVWVLNFTGHR